MKYRKLGNTELNVSEVSFGTWAIGGSWGCVLQVENADFRSEFLQGTANRVNIKRL